MVIAALLVPGTTWWASLRYYQARNQAARPAAAENKAQRQYDGSKSQREAPSRRLDPSSVEFAPVQVLRTSWNGQTDPDSVWHDQRLRANVMLVKQGLPALSTGYGAPPSRQIPAR